MSTVFVLERWIMVKVDNFFVFLLLHKAAQKIFYYKRWSKNIVFVLIINDKMHTLNRFWQNLISKYSSVCHKSQMSIFIRICFDSFFGCSPTSVKIIWCLILKNLTHYNVTAGFHIIVSSVPCHMCALTAAKSVQFQKLDNILNLSVRSQHLVSKYWVGWRASSQSRSGYWRNYTQTVDLKKIVSLL